MKIFTQHQCPECKGEGIEGFIMDDPNSPAICRECNGNRVIEKWMDAEEFMQTYKSNKIKLSQEEFKKAFNIK